MVRVPPKSALSDVIREIKANSSRWIRQKWPAADFAWQDGFGLFAVSMSMIERTREHIVNQAEHRRQASFIDELKKFLSGHGINFDPRFLEGESIPPRPAARGNRTD